MKRFSGREFAMLAAPICVIGAVSWWLSAHPSAPDNRPVHLEFHIEKPTTMEAFRGANVAFVVDTECREDDYCYVERNAPSVELQTSSGLKISHEVSADSDPDWDQDLWNYTGEDTRILMNTRKLPAGTLSYGFDGKIRTHAGTLNAVQMKEKWEVDRGKLVPFPFGQLENAPKVEVRSLKISGISKREMSVEVVFMALDETANDNTFFDYNFSEKSGRLFSYNSPNQKRLTEMARRRARTLTLHAPKSGEKSLPYIVTGRVSVDNRWPLDFESEPFDWKTAKVGQRLKFKQFPAPLPKK